MKPRNSFFLKNPTNTNYWEQQKLKLPKTRSKLFLGSTIVKLTAPAFQNTLTFNHYIINYGEKQFFWSWTMQFHCGQKKPIFTVSWHKFCFAMKIASHQDKQLTPSKSWDQDGFFEPEFGVSSNSNYRAIIFTTLWPQNQGERLDIAGPVWPGQKNKDFDRMFWLMYLQVFTNMLVT